MHTNNNATNVSLRCQYSQMYQTSTNKLFMLQNKLSMLRP